MIDPAFEILNQRGTPMFFSDVFANRPTAGIVGRIFISTDTYAFYRDTGSGWDLIGGPGTGTITGSGTIGTLPIWNGTQVIGDSSLLEGASKFTTTKDFQADGYYLSGMTGGSGALYWTSDRVTLANYNATGNVVIEAGGGQNAQTISGTNLSTTFYGNIIRNGGLSTQFLKADGSLDSNTYNTGSGAASQVAFWSGTNALTGENNLWWDSVNNHFGINTNTPATAIDVHHNQSTILQLNQTTATNDTRIAFQNSGSALWRIGNFYNAGANDWGIYDVIGAIQPLTIAKTTGQTFIGSKTTASGRLVVNSASSDAHIQVVGANAPSIRIDNAGTGATQRFVMGLSTATNNFIQGSTAGDICISTASASPLLFGMWQTINASEVMRISTANNLILGSTTDNGNRFQVTGNGYISGNFGLGTSSPSVKLQVVGDGSFSGYVNANVYNLAGLTGGGALSWTTNTLRLGQDSYFQNLQFWTNGSDRMRLDASGNLGLGVTPSAWSSYTAIQVTSGGSFYAYQYPYEQIGVVNNGYFNGSNWIYTNTGSRTSRYHQYDGQHLWYNAPSGTAGNAISFTQAMTLTESGNLLIGTTTDSGNKLQVGGNSIFNGDNNTLYAYNTSATGAPGLVVANNSLTTTSTNTCYFKTYNYFAATLFGISSQNYLFIGTEGSANNGILYGTLNNAAIIFGTNNAERYRVTSDGNLLINTTTNPGQKLYLNGSFRIDGQTSGTAGGSSGQHLIINCDGTTYKIALLNN